MLFCSFNCIQKAFATSYSSLQSVCFDSGEYKWLLLYTCCNWSKLTFVKSHSIIEVCLFWS